MDPVIVDQHGVRTPSGYRIITHSVFEGTWPIPVYSSIDEDWMPDDDDSFYEIAKNYLDK